MHFWGQAELHKHTHRPLNQEKVTVWCDTGRYWHHQATFLWWRQWELSDNGRQWSLHCAHTDQVQRKRRGVYTNTVIYQQVVAPSHCSDRSLEFCRWYFPGGRLLSRCTDFPWLLYSPDLNTVDFFLLGYLKEKIYNNNPQTLAALKDNIRREIKRIPAEIIGPVIKNFNVRVAAIIRQRGTCIEHINNNY